MKNDREVTFYHFTSVPLVKGIPSLLKKIYDTGKNILLLCRDSAELEEFDKLLWSFSTKIFLPHGTAKDQYPEAQPIFLDVKINDINKPKILVSFTDVLDQEMEKFESVIFVFFGNNQDQNVSEMYDRFSNIQSDKKIRVKFWFQDLSTGKWQQIQ
ncbi:MAG: DNA polymerase III subunit chi [Rickettsiales bacterium]|nr:DNA polymerase III subunit chi [Rickettsiales bacterium]